MDSTCMVWGERCGEKTNCHWYDTDTQRFLFSWISAGGVFLSVISDILVWKNLDPNLDLYDDQAVGKKEEMQMT